MGLTSYAVAGISPQRHLAPVSVEEIAAAVRDADSKGEAVIPFGGRTYLDEGNPPRRYDLALDLGKLEGVVEHEAGDLTATVRAGTTVASLAAHLAPHGQMWPVEVARPEAATVGGVLAAATPGPSRMRYAHPRDWILGVRAVTGEGNVTKAGGKVVKNVSGYDLARFYAGSHGTLCVIVETSLKLWPLPEAERILVARFDDVHEARGALERLRRDGVDLDAAASLDRGAAVYAGEDSALALVRLRGASAVVTRLVDRVSRALGHAEDARPGLLADAADVPLRAAITLRLSAPESRMGDALAGAGEGVLRYDGAGIACLVREKADVTWLRERRAGVERLGGSAILERAPTSLRTEFDAWGAPAIPLDLSQRIKSALDPHGTLCPGRFVGGI